MKNKTPNSTKKPKSEQFSKDSAIFNPIIKEDFNNSKGLASNSRSKKQVQDDYFAKKPEIHVVFKKSEQVNQTNVEKNTFQEIPSGFKGVRATSNQASNADQVNLTRPKQEYGEKSIGTHEGNMNGVANENITPTKKEDQTVTVKTLTKTRRVRELEDQVKSALKGCRLKKEHCEKFRILAFNTQNYYFLEKLGKGAFGEVFKAKAIDLNIIVAVKRVKLGEMERSNKDQEEKEDFRVDNISSFLVEKSILEHLSTLKPYPKFLPSYFGAFFEADERGNVENLVLVTEGGDFNLRQILEARKKLNGLNPYSTSEILEFAVYMNKAYRLLMTQRIYHSDTKLENIVFSIEKETFMIIDFGVSKFIPSTTTDVPIEEYANSGTKGYTSPEKQRYWLTSNKTDEDDDNKKGKTLFNPYRCDMWSLGICLKKMMNGQPENDPVLFRLLRGMLNENWQKRCDPEELALFLENKNIAPLKKFNETQAIDLLEQERSICEGYLRRFWNYIKANLMADALKIVREEHSLNLTWDKGPVLGRLVYALKMSGKLEEAKKYEEEFYDWYIDSDRIRYKHAWKRRPEEQKK